MVGGICNITSLVPRPTCAFHLASCGGGRGGISKGNK